MCIFFTGESNCTEVLELFIQNFSCLCVPNEKILTVCEYNGKVRQRWLFGQESRFLISGVNRSWAKVSGP